MYVRRSLMALTVSLATKLSEAFDGKLPISYSGGADAFNINDILKTGIAPVTMATTPEAGRICPFQSNRSENRIYAEG